MSKVMTDGGGSKIILGAVVCALLVAVFGGFAFFLKKPETFKDYLGVGNGGGETAPAVTHFLKSTTPSFSVGMPDGFVSPNKELPNGGLEAVITDTKEKSALLVVLRLAQGSDQMLTEEIIRAQSQGEHLDGFSNEVLQDGTKGFFFHTDSSNWKGDGIAFWFVHDGYLYELSTAAKNKALLDFLMQTFSFPASQ